MANRLVALTYFKQSSGKLYTTGSYDSTKEHMFEIYREVAGMRESGQLPGLMPGVGDHFVILVECSAHPHNVPQLIGVGEHVPLDGDRWVPSGG